MCIIETDISSREHLVRTFRQKRERGSAETGPQRKNGIPEFIDDSLTSLELVREGHRTILRLLPPSWRTPEHALVSR